MIASSFCKKTNSSTCLSYIGPAVAAATKSRASFPVWSKKHNPYSIEFNDLECPSHARCSKFSAEIEMLPISYHKELDSSISVVWAQLFHFWNDQPRPSSMDPPMRTHSPASNKPLLHPTCNHASCLRKFRNQAICWVFWIQQASHIQQNM